MASLSLPPVSQPLLLLLLLALARADQRQPRQANRSSAMRVLVLFSTTANELGLDHRIGRQALKLAHQKAIQLHPELAAGGRDGGELELVVENNDSECSGSNDMPHRVAQLYYAQDSLDQCKTLGAGEENCTGQDIDSRQLDILFQKNPSSLRRRRWTSRSDIDDYDDDGVRKVGGSIDVILGPSCHYLVDVIARMAAYWRLPIYSVASIGAQFSNKDTYPTLTRLSPSIDQLSLFIVKTMQKFNWIHMAILIDSSQIENRLLLENLERTIIGQAHLHPIRRKLFSSNSTEMLLPAQTNQTAESTRSKCTPESRHLLAGSRQVARVLLLLLNGPKTVRQLLLCAHEMGFRHDGFTFLALDLGLQASADQQQSRFSSGKQQQQQQQKFDWYLADDEENNAIAKQMFESLMVFSVELPTGDEYNLFVEQTLDLANQQYTPLRFERTSINSLAVALHDSFLLAVEAHLRHRKRKWEPNGGRGEAARVWNEHVRKSGFISTNLHINSNGDQELDYMLSDLEPELGLMRPVASFSKETRQLELLADTSIHWPRRLNTLTRELLRDSGERPPPDEPECGFDDQADHCVDRQNLYAALTILACVLGLLGTGSAFSLYKYRNIKYQMQLDDYWWKINWEDLQFVQVGAGDSLASNAQSVARALKSGGSVVSANSGGATSFISVLKPGQLRHSNLRLAASGAPSTIGGGANSAELSAASKALGRQQRRQAVPLIVTSPGNSAAGGPTGPAHPAEEHGAAGGDARSAVTRAPSGTFLTAGSVLIRSEYSSVVRASNLAMYQGELVIVKQLNAEQIEMSRELLVELKSIRELLNDNLARFIGLCLDPQRLAIVYEFCSRGSLQDLILNKEVAMDLTLKYSIIGDIVNGLSFIHTTLLDYHGRLKSTNLVLDGRFTVKITDFGLQRLYSQLDLIQNQAQDEDDEEDEDANEDDNDNRTTITGLRQQHADQVSLSVSQAAYNMESVSVVGARNRSARNRLAGGQSLVDGGGRAGSRLKLRNRGAARFFWTAPEHLREKSAHFKGSKRGDIYSLAIILMELFTRREPYYYGTNAQPNWHNINHDRRLFMQQQQQPSGDRQPNQGSSAGSRMLSSVSRRGRQVAAAASRQLGSEISASTATAARRLSQVSIQRRHAKRNSVSPAAAAAAIEPDAISVISGASHASSMGQRQQHGIRLSISAIDEERAKTVAADLNGEDPDETEREAEDDLKELRGQRTASVDKQATTTSKRLDADEILDQLRMGVHPEPVRPYIPNYVTHQISPKLIELTRACWSEQPQSRPALQQVRTQLRKISRGLASRNYLDNLLDRLQTYAADLERIVDSKSADIIGEKMRTEELLYQLVPKFVAERLKRSEPIEPQVFDGVTIFFSDIVGFEKYASVMSPTELVDLLNSVYSSFESIISSFDVTKIETIIDQFLVAAGINFQLEHQQTATSKALMVTSGDTKQEEPSAEAATTTPTTTTPTDQKAGKRRGKLSKRMGLLGSLGKGSSHGSQDQPTSGAADASGQQQQQQTGNQDQKQPQQLAADPGHYRRSSAEQIGRMALCIRDLVKSFHFRQNLNQSPGQPLVASTFNIRIGIHSGKVCTGIVGVKRPKFCLIGDTVNVASRMHTNSKANKIQISDDTRQLLEQVPGFSIVPRGKIEVKGKGLMETFWLESSY